MKTMNGKKVCHNDVETIANIHHFNTKLICFTWIKQKKKKEWNALRLSFSSRVRYFFSAVNYFWKTNSSYSSELLSNVIFGNGDNNLNNGPNVDTSNNISRFFSEREA